MPDFIRYLRNLNQEEDKLTVVSVLILGTKAIPMVEQLNRQIGDSPKRIVTFQGEIAQVLVEGFK